MNNNDNNTNNSYLIFPTKQDALNYSEQAGADVGLMYHKGDPQGTRYLYSVIEHPTDGRGAVVAAPDGSTTTTRKQMEADGWFPKSEEQEKSNNSEDQTS